jgi:hypothetical protein
MYLSKFRTRLSATHALLLKRLVAFLNALKTFSLEWKEGVIKKGSANPMERIEVMSVVDLISKLGRKVEGVNLLEIEAYLRSSKVGTLYKTDRHILKHREGCQEDFKLYIQDSGKGSFPWVLTLLDLSLSIVSIKQIHQGPPI